MKIIDPDFDRSHEAGSGRSFQQFSSVHVKCPQFLDLLSCGCYVGELQKAAAMPGAIRTASGLVYRELNAGTGSSPKATDIVTAHYPVRRWMRWSLTALISEMSRRNFILIKQIPC